MITTDEMISVIDYEVRRNKELSKISGSSTLRKDYDRNAEIFAAIKCRLTGDCDQERCDEQTFTVICSDSGEKKRHVSF